MHKRVAGLGGRGVPSVSVRELQELLTAGRPLSVVDIREPGDRDWSIPGSLMVDAYAAVKAGSLGPLADIVGLTRLKPLDFVEAVLVRIPPSSPNHSRIIELNEGGELPDDPSELEAGANRCAVV